MGVILTIHNAKKSVGPRTLFEGLAFGVENQSKIGLVGPNGSGKSSLLRCLAGLDTLDSGQITWSKSVSVEYVSQSPVFSPTMTMEEFLLGKMIDIPETQAKMWEYLSKLNVQEFDLSKLFVQLSGGEQKKCQIIKALLKAPDVILMDEPTNHLDVESIMWLEEFLNTQSQMGFIIVSHDRLFLENTVSEVIELNAHYRDGYIRSKGGYAEYIELKSSTEHAQKVHQQKQENTLRRETEWLRRGAIARLKKQQARQKATHQLKDDVDILRNLNRNRQIAIEIQSSGRTPKQLVDIEKLNLQIGEKKLFEELNLIIHKRTRIGLLGANGSGKSTLIQSIIKSAIEQASPEFLKAYEIQFKDIRQGFDQLKISGKIKCYEDIQINYFDQKRQHLDQNLSLLKNLVSEGDYVHVRGHAVFARSYLDRFNFRRDQHDLLVRELSGGEQNRLMLAQLMTKECQLMILDEPTNDLDFETLDSLKTSLEEFDGAIILVSHDRAFLDEVCTEILYFPNEEERSVQKKAHLMKFSSFLQWQDWRENQKTNGLAASVNAMTPADTISSAVSSGSLTDSAGSMDAGKNKKGGRLSYKEQREFDQMESTILEKESVLENLKAQSTHENVLSDAKELMRISEEIYKLETEIQTMYSRWQELEMKLKG